MTEPTDALLLAANDAPRHADAFRRAVQTTAHQHGSRAVALVESSRELSHRHDLALAHRRSRLEAAHARVASLHDRITESLAQFDADASALSHALQSHGSAVGSAGISVGHAQEQLRTAAIDHARDLSDDGRHVAHGAGSLVAEVDASVEQLRDLVSEVHDRLASLDHDLGEQVAAATRALQNAGERAERLADDVAGRLRSTGSSFRDTAQRALVDEAAGTLERSSHRLHDALDGLSHGALTEMQGIDGHVREVLPVMESVIHLVDTIRPVLEMVQAMLG